MPFIIIPELNFKLLIDSGSSNSFLKPSLASKHFSKNIVEDPIVVTVINQNNIINKSIEIPAFSIFDIPYPLDFKFHLLEFHNYFDGIIGLDILMKLKAKLNLVTSLLETPFCSIALQYVRSNKPPICTISVPPRMKIMSKIPVNVDNGEITIPYQKINGCEIPESLTISKNNFAITSILNPTENIIKITFIEPIRVFKFDERHTLELFNVEYNLARNKKNVKKQKLDFSQLRTGHLNSEERTALEKLINEYSDTFYIDGQDLSFTNQIKHSIKTTDNLPVYTKTYRYPFVHKEEVRAQIDKMLKQKIIRPSNSPWSSPIWVVPKKHDASGKQKWRVVIDYRKLNEKTINDKYPLPNISDILDKLGKSQYFSTLDLASGFHQIEIEEKDREKTAFSVENGHFEFLRMPFGLKNAPATFQRVMDNVLRGLLDETCLVYLDDIIIYSTSLQEHLVKLRKVFDRLRQTNFKIQIDKSEFLKKETAYLGHIISQDGVKPNPDKICAITKFPIPKTAKEIKSFLGLLGYYRKFIKDFAKLTKPMTSCLKKNSKIIHNAEFIQCFETCKNLLINDPILKYPDFNKPFILTTDASNVSIGAVLSQGTVPNDHPIAYASRTLNDSERKYSTIEKELLAIVWATKYFRPYLYGKRFDIYCDHRPLQWLFSLKEPHSKLVRWRLKLEEFDYKVIYKKGSQNQNADCLSRVEIHTKDTNPLDNQSVIVNFDQDELVQEVLNDLESFTQHSNQNENPIVGIPISEEPLNYCNNQIIISKTSFPVEKPDITKLFDIKQRIKMKFSESNFENEVINFVKSYVVPNIKYSIYFEYGPYYEPFCEVIRKTFSYPSYNFQKCNNVLLDVTTEDDIKEVILKYHEGKTNHRGIEETEQNLKKTYYWPNMRKSIQKYINECEICKLTKYERNPLKIEFNITPTPTKPFEIIHIDIFTIANTKFLTIIDAFSKLAQAYPIKSANATEVIEALLQYFNHYGLPTLIVSDRGREFKNLLLMEILELHKIKINFCSAEHSESNSPVERLHSTLIEHLRLLNTQFENSSITNKMLYAILAYNHSVHSSTKFKPIEIITGHINNDTLLDLNVETQLLNMYTQDHKERMKTIYSKIHDTLVDKKTKTISKLNEKRELYEPEINERVLIKSKQRMSKLKNKYTPQTISKIDRERKTVATNKADKKHISSIRRPPVTTTPHIENIANAEPLLQTDADSRSVSDDARSQPPSNNPSENDNQNA